jgi:hypothetical protein
MDQINFNQKKESYFGFSKRSLKSYGTEFQRESASVTEKYQ